MKNISKNLRHRFGVRLLCLLVLLSLPQVLAAQTSASKYNIVVRTEKEDAIYAKGEKIVFDVSVVENKKQVEIKSADYRLQGDGNFQQEGKIDIANDGAKIDCSLPHPGFVLCTVLFQDNAGKQVVGYGGAAVAPTELRTSLPEPADFDDFWNKKKTELARLPMNPKLVPMDVETYRKEGVEVFDVTVDCTGGKPLRAYLIRPVGAEKGKHPIFINYHGAGTKTGSYIPVALNAAKRGAIALDINAHGIENGQSPEYYEKLFAGELQQYQRQNPTDREKYYFLGMYLRLFRSLEFMKSQPEWDGKMIAVRGNSQGGGQALVAAGSEPLVRVCRATVPALCYPLGFIEGNFGGWPNELKGKTIETADPAVVRTVPYFDAALFARRIKNARCFLSTGFIDQTCSPTSVYVAYNNISTPKTIFPTPTVSHVCPKATDEAIEKLFWEIVFPGK